MIVQFMDSVAATAVYLNPDFVVTVRPDPAALDRVSLVKLRDGETICLQGDHRKVVDKLSRAA